MFEMFFGVGVALSILAAIPCFANIVSHWYDAKQEKIYSDLTDTIVNNAPVHPKFLGSNLPTYNFEDKTPKAYSWR